ncbi:MAG: hypothetical protein LBF40_04935 [Deltaproteobacteria bacterium]|jgi:hypothetical protein|nr:hypothetical protein [Deltaproteobacteria bacterium]
MPERKPRTIGASLAALPLMAVVIIASIVSCTTLITPAKDRGPAGREDENFQDFMDVPYPSALILERSKVQVYDRRGIKCGTYSLLGKLSPDEIMDYYDRHLPPYGWSPQAEAQTEDQIVSTWVKGNKTLTLEASKVTLAIGADTRLTVWMASPHTKGDLGKRVIYRDTSAPGKTYRTTPIRGKGEQSGVTEENL